MDSLLQADIFFFITSVSVVLLTLSLLVIAYYVAGIARDLRAISAKVRKAGEEIESDFEALRAHLHEEGAKGKMIVDLALGFITKKLASFVTRRPKKKPSSSEE